MRAKHKRENIAVHIWHINEQPDFKFIDLMVRLFSLSLSGTRIIKVDTEADVHAIVIGNIYLKDDIAKSSFTEIWDNLNEESWECF